MLLHVHAHNAQNVMTSTELIKKNCAVKLCY